MDGNEVDSTTVDLCYNEDASDSWAPKNEGDRICYDADGNEIKAHDAVDEVCYDADGNEFQLHDTSRDGSGLGDGNGAMDGSGNGNRTENG